MPTDAQPYRVCVVCSGNICRSPMGEVVLRARLADAGLGDLVEVDSVGTGDWHVGEQADPRARQALAARGYDGERHRARVLDPQMLRERDLFVVADHGHLRSVRALAAQEGADPQIQLLREFDSDASELGSVGDGDALDLADPFYGDDADFETCLRQVEHAADGLVGRLSEQLR